MTKPPTAAEVAAKFDEAVKPLNKFYLYGHYDSRGGATLIAAESREKADAQYLEAFWQPDESEQWRSELLEEDFIAEVTFTSYREVETGEDLEQGPPRNNGVELTEAEVKIGQAFEDGLQWAEESVSCEVPNPVWELLWARYEGEDVKELRLHPAGQSPAYEDWRDAETPSQKHWPAKPKKDGWKRANFGEDACGVIIIK